MIYWKFITPVFSAHELMSCTYMYKYKIYIYIYVCIY